MKKKLLAIVLISLVGCVGTKNPELKNPELRVKAIRPDNRPIGTLALSDRLEISETNPDGFQYWAITKGPGARRGENVKTFVKGAAKNARINNCKTLIIWTGFSGSRYDALIGYNPDLLDPAEGITLQDENDCAALIRAEGVRPGIIIRPQSAVKGVNVPKIDGSNPVGTLIWQASCAIGSGYIDFYVDTLVGADFKPLTPDELGQVVTKFPDSIFLVEYWQPGYEKFSNVIHWVKSANFKDDRPQGVQMDPADVATPDQQASWGKRLKNTGSTVLLNCRPDDPTLPTRQAGIIAAWKGAQ